MRCLETSWVHLYNLDSLDMCGDKLVARRLTLAKVDLQQRIGNEVKGNVKLQASLERRKQDLHKRQLELEQEVLRL
ncbi:hypothetical protein VIGAN_04093300 [Vigna angularis var. angularis]|uniref:Uncharacterized protein n=1 Tax=Vigna angularis var. angularis TaxID=157739 RepID=A0A0S3RT10_PHAAN|nr:hypothetical protein VIGAN_04093300 [Vigna angularis var. angularis]